jgi:hypothetical protein
MPSRVGGLWSPAVHPSAPNPRKHPGFVFGEVLCGVYDADALPGGTASYRIAGITRDANGNPLGGVTVMLFATGTDKLQTKIVSDANGNWAALVPDNTTTYYSVIDKQGSPEVAGCSVNTLTGS